MKIRRILLEAGEDETSPNPNSANPSQTTGIANPVGNGQNNNNTQNNETSGGNNPSQQQPSQQGNVETNLGGYFNLLSDETKDKFSINDSLKDKKQLKKEKLLVVKEKIEANILSPEVVEILNNKDIEKLTSTGLSTLLKLKIENNSATVGKFLKKYLKEIRGIDLKSEGVLKILTFSAIKEGFETIFKGNSPLFEFIINIDKNHLNKISFNIFNLINVLNKNGSISNKDLKDKDSWLYNKTLWKKSEEDSIYLIKLHVFLENEEQLKKFKNKNNQNNLITDNTNIYPWENALKKDVADLKLAYSEYTSDVYDEESKSKISFSEFIKNMAINASWDFDKRWNNVIELLKKENKEIDGVNVANVLAPKFEEIIKNPVTSEILFSYKVDKNLKFFKDASKTSLDDEFLKFLKNYIKSNNPV